VPNEEKELILHPDRPGLNMVLGELEAVIMEVIWRQPPDTWTTARTVYETLRQDRYLAYTTVMNTMTRLAKKGVLESDARGQTYLYRPRQSRASFIEEVVGHVLERLLVQFTGPTEAALQSYSQQHPGEEAKVTGILADIQARRAGLSATNKEGG
jgi:predicted transcriptional regulator